MPAEAAESPAFYRHLLDLRESWQARVLAHSDEQIRAAVLSILAHNYAPIVPALLQVLAWPDRFEGLCAPFYCSAGRIMASGRIAADLIDKSGRYVRYATVFRNEPEMQDFLRAIADAAKLSDAERIEFFKAARRWIVCDYRLDPEMDPADPDARHMVH